MITARGGVVAHLGGWRGDRLFFGRGPGPLTPALDLGWDAQLQTTPQRRLHLTDDALFVLEPVEGPLLLPPLRVRRFDLEGRERGHEEGADESEAAGLYFLAQRKPDAVRLRRTGLDPESGRPLVWAGTIDAEVCTIQPSCSGTPLRQGDTWWYAFREEALVRVGPAGTQNLGSAPTALVEEVAGRAVCVATRKPDGAGGWVDGEWRPIGGQALYLHFRYPRMGIAAALAPDGIVVCRQEGGEQPALQGPPARLPPDRAPFRGLVSLEGTVLGVTEGAEPELVAAGL